MMIIRRSPTLLWTFQLRQSNRGLSILLFEKTILDAPRSLALLMIPMLDYTKVEILTLPCVKIWQKKEEDCPFNVFILHDAHKRLLNSMHIKHLLLQF